MVTIVLLFKLCADQLEIRGTVTAVTDGDTTTVLFREHPTVLRLSAIDAPERKQPFGSRARQELSDLIGGSVVRIERHGYERHSRALGVAYLGQLSVNEEMLIRGFAWHYKRYSKSHRLAALERDAREAKVGLWIDQDPVPPWEWRTRKRQLEKH